MLCVVAECQFGGGKGDAGLDKFVGFMQKLDFWLQKRLTGRFLGLSWGILERSRPG